MIVEPILGILSFDPFLFGISSTSEQFGAQSTLRTVHAGVGYITLAALTTAMILELVQ
jgi:hypothetical protein